MWLYPNMVRYCHFGISPVNYSDSDSDELRHYLSCDALQLFCKINISAINLIHNRLHRGGSPDRGGIYRQETRNIATRFLSLFSHGLLTRFASIVISVNDLLTSMTELSELRFCIIFPSLSIPLVKNVHCTKNVFLLLF